MTTEPLDLDAIKARADAATPGPWWSDDSDMCWRLHGVAGRIPPQMDGAIPEQILNHQILKAPKKGTTQAEYWPNAADAEFITHAREDVPVLVAEVERLREENAELNDAVNEEIQNRDENADLLNKFAYTIAPVEVIGEHSSGNDPWENALDILTPAAEVRRLAELEERVKAFAKELRGYCSPHGVAADYADRLEAVIAGADAGTV